MPSSNATASLSQLSPAKRALLEKRLRSRKTEMEQVQTIERREKGADTLPLSFAQQRLWFVDQLEPGNATYNMASALRLGGPLKLAALERSLNEIIRRHEALRTTFAINPERQPVQVIASELKLNLQVEDLTGLTEAERESEAVALATAEARRPFDLTRGPLLRARLLRLDVEDHVLLFTMHHIVSDGWSMGALVGEFGTLYSAYAQNQKSPLPELPIQYGDFALWQRRWLQGAELDKQIAYWKQQLGGERPSLSLPTDHLRPPVQGTNGGHELFELPVELTDGLRKLSYRADATLFMTLLAAFQVLLFRYTGQEDFLIGSPTANRNRPETESLIGFFVNTLVLRADLSGNPTFRELLSRVQKMALEAYAHQDLPFEKLVEELHPNRDLSRNPLVQVVLALQNMPLGTLELHELDVTPLEFEYDVVRLDLEFHVHETLDGLAGVLAYNADLFEKETIQRFLGHFATLLEAIVADPDQLISDLPLLTSRERSRLLFEFNDTKEDQSHWHTIHELFEAQVEQRPDANAFIFEEQKISYAELERRANQLAHYLRSRGVRPETLVGLLLARSPDQIIFMLAVLKAGGAYLALDVSYPPERLSFMLQDSGVKLLLTQEELGAAPAAEGVEVIALDKDWSVIAGENTERVDGGAGADNAAYIIYTSGSTGHPKGVLVTHGSLVNSIEAMRARCREPVTGSFLQMSYAFDGALLSIFCALCEGASIAICPEGQQADAEQIARLIARNQPSHLWLVPSFYSMLLQQASVAQLQTIRAIHVGAESCPPQLVQRHLQLLPHVRLINVYGPTETTIWSTSHECCEADREFVPIGRAANNMQVYVLDRWLQPVPTGVSGRLYIGGEGVARGYWNRPELTAAAFIPNPYANEAGDRLYWTGDIARYQPNGELVWLGREDEQVKLRGYRVELGEIEAALGDVTWVSSAVVIARADASGEQRLTAYVVPSAMQPAPSPSALRDELKGKLPDYMIPTSFVVLQELPLTATGKVDRRALPEPEQGRDTLTQHFVAPGTPVEKALAGIWSEVLNIEKIGVSDDFFDLGGHSLLATQLISRVRETFSVSLPLRAVFETPTVAGLAARIDAEKDTGKASSPPPLVPVPRTKRRQVRLSQATHAEELVPIPREGPLPLSFAQQRLWFMQELEPESAAYNMAFAERLKGVLDQSALEATLTEIGRRHETLRTSFAVTEGQIQQIVGPPTDVVLLVSDLGHLPEAERLKQAHSIATEEARQPFELRHGPLYRARLLRLGDEDHLLLFTMHHIITDGWGLGVLLREVGTLYEAFANGLPSPLPPLPIQYADFAHWQRRQLVGEMLDSHLPYWQQRLSGRPAALELPTDRPRPAIQSFRGGGERLLLPAKLTEQLKAMARREGVTLFMLLLAVFKVLLHRYTGEEDIIIGCPIANRNRLETEGLIGFFVNMLVLRTDLSGSPTFRQLLARVRTTALEAYAHQDLPFEKLVEHLHPERSMSRHPLFQVMFQLGNAPLGEAKLAGLTFESIDIAKGTTQFDLSLDLLETNAGILTVAEYSTDLFDAGTIVRLLQHFQNLLEAVVDQPVDHQEQPIARLSMLTKNEREQLIYRWNDTGKVYPANTCLTEAFSAQVKRTPKAIAVDGAEQLTYEDLNHRANQLAHYLRGLGVGPEVKVGVLLERSVEMVVSLLAVLKADGAYLPLDPAYPQSRLSYLIADAQVSLVLTQRHLREAIPDQQLRIVCVDDAEAEAIAREDASDPGLIANAENLAYVIYTSGSTGRPKGVGVTHDSLLNHQAAVRQVYELGTNDRVLQFASLSFDVAAEEIFPSLLSGATVVLRDEKATGLSDLPNLLREVEERNITVLNLPASAWQECVVKLSAGSRLPDCLRLLIVGSEPVSRESFAVWQKAAGDRVRVLNAYGTTETTITATLYQPGAHDHEPDSGLALPIGRPLGNTRAYVLDRSLQPAPVGIPGELCIGGAGVSRGYLNYPEATGKSFIPDPFGNEPGSRLYRTGDLARFLPDGNIEFLGRADRQVKIRGYRIELGEVEAILKEHPGVRHAVVEPRQDFTGNNQLVGYIVAERDRTFARNELREFVKERLPEFMAPSVFVMMEELPLTSGGKVDRQALASHASHETVRSHSEPLHLPASRAERLIAKVWQELLQVETVDIDENFFDLGGHSLLMVRVHDRLREAFDKKLTMLDLFKYPTVRTLSAYLVTEQPPLPQVSAVMVETPKDRTRSETNEIAIVGMAGRFPGARSLDHFWQNLCAGVEAVNFYSDEELLAAGVDPSLLSNPNYVKAGVILEDIDLFDASFFGYSPREAEAMDPQHRLFLECAWEALEHAGHDPDQSGGSVGVFAGTGTGTYVYNLLSSPGAIEAIGGLQLAIGNDKDHLPTHVSYKLNLRGPSVAVQTACSASLTAVHMACRSVLAGECRMALAGGVAIHDLEKRGYLFQQGGIGSPDGHCRAFDAAAQGTISGSGVGIVVLKRLQDALADGDFIHAVIKGSAINNDGSAKVGYTAPSVEGQAEVIRAAQVAAGVSAEDITYIEAHGTGTRLGDPIEISALTQAFRASTDLRGFCAVGSLKTNIGHLDTAAGVAGLIKTVLALEHKVIPPSLHFDEPNPALDLDSSPFYVNKHLAGWQSSGGPRYAGVSSFGIGGTNAHVIVQEAPLVRPSGGSRPWQLLMLSAKSGQALDQATTGLVQYLKKHPETNLGDIAYTLQVGRKSFSHRRAVVCHKIDDALRTLELPDSRQLLNSSSVGTSPGVVFMFPGQGAQHVGMGLELYRHEIAFREQVDYCCEQLKQHLGFDLRDVLYPSEENSEEASLRLKQTSVTQPALFVVEYALARVWMGWGVKPRAMIGHSIGEYVAACLAGVMALEDALTLVALRGKLMQSLPEGTMLSVALSEDELRGLLGPQLSLAVINGPSLSVASGPEEAIAELQDRLTGMNVGCRRLVTSHAFHSQMMDPVLEEFRTQVARVKLNEPTIPYLSNLTGTWAQPSEVTEPGYWARHLRETVRFAAGARELLANGNGANSILLEVGPGRTLCSLVTGLARETGQPVINSLPPVGEHESGDQTVATALARLWLSGVPINWKEFYARETRHRLPLPTYPFERRRYWVDWQKPPAGDGLLDGSLRKQPDIADWFYLPYWKPSVLPGISGSAEQSSVWLVFLDALGFSQQVVTQLEKQGCEVITVKPGALFERLDDRTFIINVSEPKDYEALLLELKMLGKAPDNVLHALSLNDKADVPLDHERLEEALGDCFYSLIFLARALGQHAQKDNVTIAIMSNGVRRVLGDDRVVPEKATLLGPCSVIPQEYPFITCRSIDVALPGTRTWQESALVKLITSDLISGSRDSAVAYRANQRWTQAFEATRIQPIPGVTGRLRQGGVYLITGGLGGIGLEIARHLAKTVQAKLVLVGRSQLPWKNEWQDWLSTHTDNDETSNKIRRVLELEALGAEVLVASANVANTAEMQAALRQARERFGGVNGVIHSAGIAPGRLIQAEQDELAVNTLAPKVTGARVLEDLFKQEELDFLILFSSLSAILGAFGQVDYGAANAFLDAFAAYNIQQNGVPTVSINWDTWSETGMALRAMQSFNTGLNTTATVSAPGENGADHEEANQEELQSLIRDGMATVEGLEVFDRILAHDLMPQVIVSTRALQSVIKATEARTQAQIFDEMVRLQQAGPSYPRPDIQTAHVAPRNELEEQIAGIWESLLGIEGIGVDDNFFELGGHSLLATQLLSRLRETMSVDLPLRIIFEHPNVAALAKYVEQTWLEVVAAPPPIAKADRPSRRARRPRQT